MSKFGVQCSHLSTMIVLLLLLLLFATNFLWHIHQQVHLLHLVVVPMKPKRTVRRRTKFSTPPSNQRLSPDHNCSSCAMHENETLTSDFACSSTLAWQYGRRVFLDPLPQNATHAHDVVQVLFTLTGSFNCDLLSNPTNVSLLFSTARSS
jgi:hypothetical protein